MYVSLVYSSPEDLASSRCLMVMSPCAYTGKAHRPLWTKFFQSVYIVISKFLCFPSFCV